MIITNNADMAQYTSFKAGGKARRLLVVDTPEELKEALEDLHTKGENYLILGNGTNTLFAAEVYDGTVIKLGEGFDYIEIEECDENPGCEEETCNEETCTEGTRNEGNRNDEEKDCDAKYYRARAGAATLLSRLSKAAAAKGLTGLEFAAGIPGSIGGAVFMNAGAYDGVIKDTLKEVKVLAKASSGEYEIKTMKEEELNLSYRHSILMETGDIVLEAEFLLPLGVQDEINSRMKDYSERRSSKQPLEYPSAGSFFKRPEGSFAGKLIEDSGLKGLTVGGAQVSEKHAGFIINVGGATYDDILELMKQVQTKVKDDYGVDLEPEVRIIK